jgi:NAD(P)-dependent dehydrogenase (short-subunit alcohol dehydrogenase family)
LSATQTQHLADRVAIVTGAAQGNGRALALAGHGATLVMVDINAAWLEEARGEIAAGGREAVAIVADCADVAGIRGAVAQVRERFGRLDVLINNAGILRISSFPDIYEADFDATFNLNVKGAFFLMQEAHALMSAGAAIVNIASVAGVDGRTLSAPYAAGKAALVTLTKTLARALAPRRITVNAVAPDAVGAFAGLAARCAIPLATGELEATRWPFRELIERRGIHIVQADATVCGGVTEWLRIAHLAAGFDLPMAPH